MKKALPKPNAMEILKARVRTDVITHPAIRMMAIPVSQIDQLLEVVMQAVTARVGQLKTSAIVTGEERERVSLMNPEDQARWFHETYVTQGIEQIAMHMGSTGLIRMEETQTREGHTQLDLFAWVVHPEGKRPGIDQ